jgi:hypothetical protein
MRGQLRFLGTVGVIAVVSACVPLVARGPRGQTSTAAIGEAVVMIPVFLLVTLAIGVVVSATDSTGRGLQGSIAAAAAAAALDAAIAVLGFGVEAGAALMLLVAMFVLVSAGALVSDVVRQSRALSGRNGGELGPAQRRRRRGFDADRDELSR